MVFPYSSVSKESACNAGAPGSIPGSERSPAEGNGNPLQYSCLENPTDRGAWQATVYGVARVGHDWATKHTHTHCSMSGSNCCFLTCMQISQKEGKVIWYSHLFKKFPQFVVIHTVKGFSVVNKAEVNVFWNYPAFAMIQRMLVIWSLVPLPFLNPVWTSGSSQFTYCWSLAWRILSITLLACEMSTTVR